MTLSEWSYAAMVAAAVVYLVALGLHAWEWGSSRGLAAVRPEDGSEDARRLRVDFLGRLGLMITVIGAVLQLVAVVLRGIAGQRAPWGNMYEFVSSSLLFAVIAYVVCAFAFDMRWLGLGVTLVLSIGLGLAVTEFYVDVAPLMPALHSVWFIIHIVAACISGAAFNLGGLAAVAYLVKDSAERKAGEAGVVGYLAKLPTPRTLDMISYRLIAFAVPLWTFTIVAGAIWAQYAWGRFWNWDPKETWSFITWLVYVAYLHARATGGWRGRPVAYIAVLGVVTFWFNFIGVNLLFSGLHAYSGI